MKIAYQHILKNISENPSKDELSEKFFQLGHEHEIQENIFDMDITPNRGDCLSLHGLLRDLNVFYEVKTDRSIYEKPISHFDLVFENKVKEFCPKISFLKVEIDEIPKEYNDILESYFSYLDIKKNNFFTDLSNYISYETGQPTHCYDSKSIGNKIILNKLKNHCQFETLINKKINITEDELVFMNDNEQVINLAGVIGGKNTACNNSTKSVIIECAYFLPEIILGKTLKHNINSEAAHKFERNTDAKNHEYVLRRLLKLIEEHTNILSVEIFSEITSEFPQKMIPYNLNKINSILGTNISNIKASNYLNNLGFEINNSSIYVPSYRHDITNENDIAEEIARVIGYDNIEPNNFMININESTSSNNDEEKIKNLLIDNGFYEVINDPFVAYNEKFSVEIVNPLDSNKRYLRTNLKDSLIENLLFNERRQKDCVKLFEIADIYSSDNNKKIRKLGIIASGRVDKNYRDFSKKIDDKYLNNILEDLFDNGEDYSCKNILRDNLNSKSKYPIYFVEMKIDNLFKENDKIKNQDKKIPYYNYRPISDFPSSTRDLSYSIKDFSNCTYLQEYILNFRRDILKEVFIFDYFLNEKNSEIKIGFRFIFQDQKSTVTESQVNDIMDVIISETTKLNGVNIPGLKL